MDVRTQSVLSRAEPLTSPDDIDMHFYLTRAMARRHGVNLSEALNQGLLTRADFAAMVSHCADCPGGPADCRPHPAKCPSANLLGMRTFRSKLAR